MSNIVLAAGSDEGYQISRSVRLRSSASAYFNRTPASAGNRQIYTWSGWVKRGTLGGTFPSLFWANNGSTSDVFQFNNADALRFFQNDGTSSFIATAAVFRDPSAWYHIVLAVDTTQATASNRVKIYVNGVSQNLSGSTYPTQNYSGYINNTFVHRIGNSDSFDGYLTEINFIDGQALTPASFGETDSITGVWKPKKYAGTYGTNGFYLNFSDPSAATAAAIGKDYSGNGNNWTPNNISVTAGVTYDSMLDVPTLWGDGGNGRGNYATLNPISPPLAGGAPRIADGNLRMTGGFVDSGATFSTITLPSSGAFYAETQIEFTSGTYGFVFGISDNGNTSTVIDVYVANTGGNQVRVNGSNVQAVTPASQDVWSISVDCGTGIVYIRQNNTLVYTSSSLAVAGKCFFFYRTNNAGGYINFGQRPFSYTPPTGFKALNTQNLPEPTIKKGNQYFDATTYAGNGAARTITNNGAMQPDLVWVKNRSGANNHVLFDSIRGFGSGKELSSNLTGAENAASSSLYGFVSASTSSGFSVAGGTDPTYTYDLVNASTANYVAWQWKESVSAGFDIVTYTQSASTATVNHSLGVAPKMIIVKDRTGSGTSWYVYHASIGAGNFLTLNSTAAQTANTGIWNNTAPTSSVFSWGPVWSPGDSIVAYLFAEVAGFSKFGSYTGNGSADGPFVFCGFRPRWVMIKRTDAAGNWIILDAARNVSNEANAKLYPNLSNAEDLGAAAAEDFLSNGFKLRATWQDMNQNGATYIFMAFAEAPFKNSLAR